MRDTVVKGNGNFDYLRFFNVRPNLSTPAYNISASIRNAAASQLTREDISFIWGEDQQQAFHELHPRMQTPLLLTNFDEDTPTILHTDASNMGLRALLVQLQDDNEKAIAYASNRQEQNITTLQ